MMNPAGNEKSYHYKLAILGSQPCTAESRHRFGGFIRASLPGCYRLQGLSDRFLYVHARYPFVCACVF